MLITHMTRRKAEKLLRGIEIEIQIIGSNDTD